MRTTIDTPGRRAALVRMAWFVGLWVAGVLAVGAVATVLRWVLKGWL